MKKFVFILIIMLMLPGCFLCTSAYAEENEKNSYIYVESLNEGVYNIDVKSSSSMFRIVNCELKVSNGEMTAVMTLSGTGYEKLFMGTGEEALKSSDDKCIHFVKNDEGKYTYTVPVEALDMDIDCAAWSIRKEKWYDRVLVFQSETLPKEAFVQPFNAIFVVIPLAAVLAVATVVIIIVNVKKRKNKENGYKAMSAT